VCDDRMYTITGPEIRSVTVDTRCGAFQGIPRPSVPHNRSWAPDLLSRHLARGSLQPLNDAGTHPAESNGVQLVRAFVRVAARFCSRPGSAIVEGGDVPASNYYILRLPRSNQSILPTPLRSGLQVGKIRSFALISPFLSGRSRADPIGVEEFRSRTHPGKSSRCLVIPRRRWSTARKGIKPTDQTRSTLFDGGEGQVHKALPRGMTGVVMASRECADRCPAVPRRRASASTCILLSASTISSKIYC